MESLESLLQERIAGIEDAGLVTACIEQRHLDAGTDERTYWHYGYASALKDIVRILQSTHSAAN
jgi:nucleoside 2-deoxyribosyltransferase